MRREPATRLLSGSLSWRSSCIDAEGIEVSLWDDGIAPVQELIRAKQPVDPDRMADASVPLVAHVMA